MHPGAHKRIDLIDLRKQSGPCTFARIDVDFLAFIRQWLIAKVFRGYAVLVGSSPPLRSTFRYPRHFVPTSLLREASSPYRRMSCKPFGGMC
jgi:hypothetical protein